MTDNSPMRKYVNEIESTITCKIKSGFYLELLTPETIKLIGKPKKKIIRSKIGESVPHLETTEVVIVYYNIVNNDYH